jgi:glycosyltransferase involved in cell wall biosynthesis
MLRADVRRAGFQVLLNTLPEGIAGLAIPQITVLHDLTPLRFPADYPRQQYYFRHFVPQILRTSRVVVTDSESTCRDVIDHYRVPSAKIRVVYPGYDSVLFSRNGDGLSPCRSEEPYFLYVGNLLPHKNLLRLLDATAMVRRRRPCRLVIRGEGRPGYMRMLRERIETLGLGEAVTFFGYVNERFLRNLYTGAAGFVLPSLGEGFGLTILEAMACGTPVVAASGSSLPEVAGDAALMVDPYDAVSLADAMYRVLTDDRLQKRLRQLGLERVGSFSWRSTAERISTLLDEKVAYSRGV